MDKTNSTTNNENLLPKFKTPGVFYVMSGGIVFLIIMLFMIFYDFKVTSFGSPSKSQQELVANIFKSNMTKQNYSLEKRRDLNKF